MLTLASKQYRVIFKSLENEPKKYILNEEQIKRLDAAHYRFRNEDKDLLIKMPDGGKFKISAVAEITPLTEKQKMITDLERIKGHIALAAKGKTPKATLWLGLMKDNIERIKRGKPWQHYTVDGKPCTAEQARKNFWGEDLTPSQRYYADLADGQRGGA